MNFYSYKGQEPQGLPESIRLDDGSLITSLNELTEEQLHSYGFIGPVIKPLFDAETQKLVWNGNDYDIVNLNEQELSIIKSLEEESIRKGFRITDFWQQFRRTAFYYRLRKEAITNDLVSILYSEFISLSKEYSDINQYINKFFLILDFTEQEILSLSKVLDFYHLSPVPDEEYLSTYIYDFDIDDIVDTSTRPFASWKWNGTKWQAPVSYPTDGSSYVWNESTLSWDLV